MYYYMYRKFNKMKNNEWERANSTLARHDDSADYQSVVVKFT